MRRDKVRLYTDHDGQWRWRYVANNGRILADSGQGYSRRKDAVTAAERVTSFDLSDPDQVVLEVLP